eukprot:scaffold3374_cov153-Pinguiococcus_pyrenoidosus.AAC.5
MRYLSCPSAALLLLHIVAFPTVRQETTFMKLTIPSTIPKMRSLDSKTMPSSPSLFTHDPPFQPILHPGS